MGLGGRVLFNEELTDLVIEKQTGHRNAPAVGKREHLRAKTFRKLLG